ncbi:hypothetical protein D3C76_944860 [compost metagenome]
MVRPANDGRNAKTTFPVSVLLAAKRCDARIRPLVEVHAVVGGVNDNGIVGDAQIIEFFQQLTHMTIVLEHAIVVLALP